MLARAREVVPVEVIPFTEEMYYTVGSAKKAIYQSASVG